MNQTELLMREGISSNPMNQALKPFQKITVAYDDSPGARDAVSAGIDLCKLLSTPLQTITIIEPPPIYTGLVVTVAPDVAQGRWVRPFPIPAGRRLEVECVEVGCLRTCSLHLAEEPPNLKRGSQDVLVARRALRWVVFLYTIRG
jgi:hypothetical protein